MVSWWLILPNSLWSGENSTSNVFMHLQIIKIKVLIIKFREFYTIYKSPPSETSNIILNALGIQAVIRPDDQDLTFGDPEEA